MAVLLADRTSGQRQRTFAILVLCAANRLYRLLPSQVILAADTSGQQHRMDSIHGTG